MTSSDQKKHMQVLNFQKDRWGRSITECLFHSMEGTTDTHLRDSQRNDYRNNYRGRYVYPASRTRDHRAPYPPLRREYNHKVTLVLTLDSLTKHPKEILATKTQLCLLAPRPMIMPLRSGNTDRYCDYHQEKGYYTNDYIQLRKQLEMALELGKLNHLVKDVRQRGMGSHSRDAPQPAKIINVISVNSVKDKKQKGSEITKSWMNIRISFPAISSEDISEEPLIVEAKVEGYLARLKETQTDLVGFVGEISKSLGKIELEMSRKETYGRGRKIRGEKEVAVMEEVLVNSSFPDQRVSIGRGLS
nr:reverse transcriptase domain-containing protein [Tanacetum cinerariifolium]